MDKDPQEGIMRFQESRTQMPLAKRLKMVQERAESFNTDTRAIAGEVKELALIIEKLLNQIESGAQKE